MMCCGERTKVCDSRVTKTTIRRRRQCGVCNKRFTTMEVKTKTHCKNGHKLDGENMKFNSQGNSFCVTCKNESNSKYMREVRNYGK